VDTAVQDIAFCYETRRVTSYRFRKQWAWYRVVSHPWDLRSFPSCTLFSHDVFWTKVFCTVVSSVCTAYSPQSMKISLIGIPYRRMWEISRWMTLLLSNLKEFVPQQVNKQQRYFHAFTYTQNLSSSYSWFYETEISQGDFGWLSA
jgi:hypothetical protein